VHGAVGGQLVIWHDERGPEMPLGRRCSRRVDYVGRDSDNGAVTDEDAEGTAAAGGTGPAKESDAGEEVPSEPVDPWDFSKPVLRSGTGVASGVGQPVRSSRGPAGVGGRTYDPTPVSPARPGSAGRKWLLAALLIVVVAAIAVPLALTSGTGKRAIKRINPSGSHSGSAISSRSTPTVTVPSLSADLLPASALGPGWRSGGIGTGSSNGDLSRCAEPLWSIYNPPNYPAGSVENFGGFVNSGNPPLWSDGVSAFNAGDEAQTGSTFAEAVGEDEKAQFAALLTTVASCGAHFYSYSDIDPIELTPVQPFKFGTQSTAYLMTQNPGDQLTYIGFIVAGSKYSCFWFNDFREPNRLTVFMQLASKVASQLTVAG
jgi:hypothetical protein